MLRALLNFKLLSLILSDRYLKVPQWPLAKHRDVGELYTVTDIETAVNAIE